MRTGVLQPLPGIGDMMWLLPALQAIAASCPDKKITLFTKKSTQADSLLAGEAMIDRVLYLPHGRGLAGVARNWVGTWAALHQARLDRIFVLHQSQRYRLLARLAGIREVIAYPPDLARSKQDGWQKSLTFLERLSIPISNRNSNLSVRPNVIDAVKRRFAAYPQPWFVVSPGASEPTRRWPADRFAACADALIEKQGGTVFLTGVPSEAECVDAVYRLCLHKEHVVSAMGLPFDHFLGLMACSKAVLGNCSGPANVAATLGRPAFMVQAISHAPLHSPNMIMIKPDLAPEQAQGLERISTAHAIEVIFSKL